MWLLLPFLIPFFPLYPFIRAHEEMQELFDKIKGALGEYIDLDRLFSW